GRLHFHAVHFMRTLPTGSVDPNFGRRVRNRRQLNSLQNTWPYGYSMPIAVRYTQDAFSRSGFLPFKALMFLTLMRPSLVLFLVLWLKLVKDFLKVRCRLALLPFLISCLIWLDLVASLPLIK